MEVLLFIGAKHELWHPWWVPYSGGFRGVIFSWITFLQGKMFVDAEFATTIHLDKEIRALYVCVGSVYL